LPATPSRSRRIYSGQSSRYCSRFQRTWRERQAALVGSTPARKTVARRASGHASSLRARSWTHVVSMSTRPSPRWSGCAPTATSPLPGRARSGTGGRPTFELRRRLGRRGDPRPPTAAASPFHNCRSVPSILQETDPQPLLLQHRGRQLERDPQTRQSRARRTPGAHFVEVLSPPAPPVASPDPLQLVLETGLRVRVPAQFDHCAASWTR